VVSALGLHHAAPRRIVARLADHYPATPVVVQAPSQLLGERVALVAGRVPLVMPVTGEALLDSVRLALAGGPFPGGRPVPGVPDRRPVPGRRVA
jgi:hypothetical protein